MCQTALITSPSNWQFHNYSNHWALTHFRDSVIYLYDSLQMEQLHPELKMQMLALYGPREVKQPYVQQQKGSKDCGCFAIAFSVSLLYGEDPSTLVYEQEMLREHIVNCFTRKHFLPFPAKTKKMKCLTPPLELNLE